MDFPIYIYYPFYMTKRKKQKLLFVTQEWSDCESFLNELTDALSLFDLFLIKDPYYESHEGQGYIISRMPLTKKIIKTLSKKHHSSSEGFEL